MFLLNLGRTCWYASWWASSTVIPSFWNSFFASLKVDSNLDVHERSLMPLHTLSSSSSSSVLFWLSELLLSSSSPSSSSLPSSSPLSPSSAMLSCSSELSRSSEASVPWANDSSESASLLESPWLTILWRSILNFLVNYLPQSGHWNILMFTLWCPDILWACGTTDAFI